MRLTFLLRVLTFHLRLKKSSTAHERRDRTSFHRLPTGTAGSDRSVYRSLGFEISEMQPSDLLFRTPSAYHAPIQRPRCFLKYPVEYLLRMLAPMRFSGSFWRSLNPITLTLFKPRFQTCSAHQQPSSRCNAGNGGQHPTGRRRHLKHGLSSNAAAQRPRPSSADRNSCRGP